jgi:hypothetical protein
MQSVGLVAVLFGVNALSFAQVPDLLNAFDAGGRALGTGGAGSVTDSDTFSILNNPAALAFVHGSTFGVSFRNLPDSRTIASGNFTDRTLRTDPGSGRISVSHVGYAAPFRNGTIGISYTIGGFVQDTLIGNNLTNGALTVRNLTETTKSKTDFFTIGYGRSSGSTNVGVALVFANQYLSASQRYVLFDGSNNQVGTVDSSATGNNFGVGLVVGLQSIPSSQDNLMWGFSVRTPISLGGEADTKAYYDRIPGKASLGVAGRRSAGRGDSQDFLTWAAQADYFFGGNSNGVLEREDTFSFGAGLEYNFHRFNARIPVRLGFMSRPGQGRGFGDRDALTFGLGYRPNASDYSIDLNFARPSSGGALDIALGVTYKPSR